MWHNPRNAIARDGSRTAATSKMERFVIIVNGWKPWLVTCARKSKVPGSSLAASYVQR